jgi:hypothetical protein
VAAYLASEAETGLKPSTIGAAPVRKAPAVAEIIRDMVHAAPTSNNGLRDRALLLLGVGGAFRRSELVALDVADLEETDDGLRVTIRRSKTDQEGIGTTIAVVRGGASCPVKALRAWLDAARITEGAVSKPPCFSSSNVARAGCCATEGASCVALPIAVARAKKRRFLIGTSPSAAHHNERNQIAKSSDARQRPLRPCDPGRLPMTPPTGPYVSAKIDPTKPDGDHPLAQRGLDGRPTAS